MKKALFIGGPLDHKILKSEYLEAVYLVPIKKDISTLNQVEYYLIDLIISNSPDVFYFYIHKSLTASQAYQKLFEYYANKN